MCAVCLKETVSVSLTQLVMGSPRKLQMSPHQGKELTLGALGLWLSRDSSVFWVTATMMLASYFILKRIKLKGNTWS